MTSQKSRVMGTSRQKAISYSRMTDDLSLFMGTVLRGYFIGGGFVENVVPKDQQIVEKTDAETVVSEVLKHAKQGLVVQNQVHVEPGQQHDQREDAKSEEETSAAEGVVDVGSLVGLLVVHSKLLLLLGAFYQLIFHVWSVSLVIFD